MFTSFVFCSSLNTGLPLVIDEFLQDIKKSMFLGVFLFWIRIEIKKTFKKQQHWKNTVNLLKKC